MGQILIRNIDDQVIRRLEERAKVDGVSVEDIARVLIETTAPSMQSTMSRAEAIARMDAMRTESGAIVSLNWDEIRDERDARHFVEGVDDERFRP